MGDVTDKYIDNVQQQWKQYRNLVKDGFIYNDSFLVINDYEEILSDNNDLAADPASLGDIPNLGFESTLMGMVNALQEIQSKGDQMMNAINDQKKVLVKLRSEVNKAENRLERAMKVTNEIEMKRSEAENEIKTAERDTRMLSRRKEDLESEIRNLDQEKDEMKTTLEALQEELSDVEEQMEAVSKLRSNLDPLEKNYKTRQRELENLEKSLQSKSAQLVDVKQQIQQSTKVLNDIKNNLALSPSVSLEDKTSQSVSPYLVPALAVSLVLNLVTGGAIISNYMDDPTQRNDEQEEPFQFISSAVFDSISNLGRSEPLIDNDKMDRNESQLKYIGSDESMDSSDHQEQRFSNMYTQDAYYDLPRYLYF